MATNNLHSPLITDRLALFPDSTRIENDSLTIAGCTFASLADEYGTPLYIYDRRTMDTSTANYISGLRSYYPASSAITYASKAFLCKAIAQWAHQHELWIDCTGESEIRIAEAGGIPPEKIVMHGVNKSNSDLLYALNHAGAIIVDNLSELKRISNLFANHPFEDTSQPFRTPFPDIWLRLQPGYAIETHHAYTQTGQQGSKFGMTSEEIIEAADLCKSSKLPLTGLHFHLGSNFRDTSPLVSSIDLGVELAREIGLGQSWHFCPGGGWGIAYHEIELPHPDIEDYVRAIAERVIEKCKNSGLSFPVLHLEPGRSLMARAGVALYRIGTVKRHSDRTWLLIDGGMADNLRPALYGSRYSCLPVSGLNREFNDRVSIAGPYCESGDVVIEDLPMPTVEEGELLALPVSGAYHLSMASNYNGACRPAVVWMDGINCQLIVRRETPGDLSLRDLSIT